MRDDEQPLKSHGILHRILYGHYKRQPYLYYDKYYFPVYSFQCMDCPDYCERIDMGYNCKGSKCPHPGKLQSVKKTDPDAT